jgi:long-chain acyl-CoA synthetase
VPNSKVDGFSEIYRNKEYADKDLSTTYDPEIKTLYDLFENSLSKFGDRSCMGTRTVGADGKPGNFEFQTYKEIGTRRDNLGSGLRANYGLNRGDHVGIFSINRPEWIIAEQAGHAYSFVGIALYATLGPNAIEFIINHAEIGVIVAGGKHISSLIGVKKNCPTLRVLVSMDDVDEETIAKGKQEGVTVVSMSTVESEGAASPVPHEPVTPDDLGTIMYTSGTTGDPKGVMLTQKTFIAEVGGVMAHGVNFTENEVHLSYLPLAHSFERAVIACMMAVGAQVGFFRGIVPELFDDIAALRPTFLVGAPRVWGRLYDKVTQTIEAAGGLKKKLFWMGYNRKIRFMEQGFAPDNASPFFDKLVFKKTKARLGGRVRFILSGSAPLDGTLAKFLMVCFSCSVVQGYGLTENCAGCCITAMDDMKVGHVGFPMTCTEIRLADLPEMNYLSTDEEPRGEVCLRGPNVFLGYYKDPEKTSEVLADDGWFRTGDVGRWNKDGTLSIIDRAKNIFKLAQGEYVAAEYLEGVYIRNVWAMQVFVYGDSYQSCLVGVIVPDIEMLAPWAKSKGKPEDLASLVADPEVHAMILESIKASAKENNLKGFEVLKDIHLSAEPFSTENDLMTPSFKLRRPQLKAFYKEKLDGMYEKLKAEEAAKTA